MQRRRTALSWMAALALLSLLSVSYAWNLGRTPASPRRIPFSRRYRRLDHDEEKGRTIPKLRILRRKQKMTSTEALPIVVEQDLLPVSPSIAEELSQSIAEELCENTAPPSNNKKSLRRIHNVQELRQAVLDDGLELQKTELAAQEADVQVEELLNHEVIKLIAQRSKTRSTPGNRLDNATLALSIEGGGMRGAVSAGMAAAIASLDLCDAFDAIYGSSAGSVVGAYMVSRQMCVDVYTEVLPAAQTTFVCKKRMMAGIMASAVDLMASTKLGQRTSPGMNISFVLDGIMDHDYGLRPLDLESFQANNVAQPLRIATSSVEDGKLISKCLGTKDFFPYVDPLTNQSVSATVRQDGRREGLYACLEAGMTVPGATGPPVILTDGNNKTSVCFDAFCFEPVPYRSAVEDGATHVLALRSRPEGFQPTTKPGVYEKGVATIYFRSHGQEDVARFFEQGGQQYIYLEDLLTLEEGRLAGVRNNNIDGVHVPPTKLLYGVDDKTTTNRDEWKKAHLLPLVVPKGTPELPTLEQGQDQVLEAVRGGFAVAFDLLSPVVDLKLDPGMTGERVARLVFPKQAGQSMEEILGEQVSVRGRSILQSDEKPVKKRKRRILVNFGRRVSRPFRLQRNQKDSTTPLLPILFDEGQERCHRQDATTLLSLLPGIQNGCLAPLSDGLHYCRSENTLL